MGNTQTPDGADHDYYRRPKDGMEPQRSVQIIDDGSGPASGPDDGAAPAAVPGAAAVRGSAGNAPAQGGAGSSQPAALPVWRRVNVALVVAWVLVGAVLAVGLAWLTGIFSAPQMYFDPSSNQPSSDSSNVIAMNLYSMGPFLMLFGIIGAFTLLAVQAAGFRRRAGS